MTTTAPSKADMPTNFEPNQSQRQENSDALLKVAELCYAANAARVQGDNGKAWNLYHEVLKIDPGCVVALANIGDIQWNVGNKEDAIRLVNQAITLKPDYAEAYQLLAGIYSDLRDTNKCLQMCDATIALKPKLFYPHFLKAEKMLELGYHEQALINVHKALEIAPSHPAVQLQEEALFRWKTMKNAKMSYGLEMKPDEKDFEASVKKGDVLISEIQEALAFLNRARYVVSQAIADGHVFTLRSLREPLNQIERELSQVKNELPEIELTSFDLPENYQIPRANAQGEKLLVSSNVSQDVATKEVENHDDLMLCAQHAPSKTLYESSKLSSTNIKEFQHYETAEAHKTRGNAVPSKEERTLASQTLYGFSNSPTETVEEIRYADFAHKYETSGQNNPLITSKELRLTASKTLHGFSKTLSGNINDSVNYRNTPTRKSHGNMNMISSSTRQVTMGSKPPPENITEVKAFLNNESHQDSASQKNSSNLQPQKHQQGAHERPFVTNSKIHDCLTPDQNPPTKKKIYQALRFQDRLQQLKTSGQKYTDPDFPPNLKSLTGGVSQAELAAMGHLVNYESLIWLRIEDIYGKGNFQVFQGKIEFIDVEQGALGNCYFLSTVAVLAKWPDRIRRLFETDTPNDQGCYGVRICYKGIWQTVVIDDYLPCSIDNRPCFARSNGNEVWVQLLEKAWAKVYGSYAGTDGGFTSECLQSLTGAPTQNYLTQDPSNHEKIWKEIVKGDQYNFIMTCGSGDVSEVSKMGLVPNHAYSLLGVFEICDKYSQKERLVKLGNPWSKGEWTGDWSDESPTWTEELKRQLQVKERDDGIFYMSFNDMLKYFTDIQICMFHDNLKYKALRVTSSSRHALYFKLAIKVQGRYYISITQGNFRKSTECQYSDVSIVLGKKTNYGYEYIAARQEPDRKVWIEEHLDVGEYIVFSKAGSDEREINSFIIASYGEHQVEIEEIPKAYCPDFIFKVHLNKGRQSKELEDYGNCGVPNCYRKVDITNEGFGFIYYRNESDKTLEEHVDFDVFEGLKLRKPYKGNNFKMVVPPGQERVVITKVLSRADGIKQTFTNKARFF